MKHLLTITAVIALLAGTAFAGPAPSYKKTVVEPRPEVFGLGLYGALQAGMNLFQDNKTDILGTDSDGDHISVHPNSSVGGFGGGKLGYVFNTGRIRPAAELDLFYNGFGSSYEIDNGPNGNGNRNRFQGIPFSVNSVAFIPNLLVRFDFGRIQPYIGGGLGGYYASTQTDTSFGTDLTSRNTCNWAWQVVGGCDYYFTEKVSAFAEYKFLNYENYKPFAGSIGSSTERLGQQLVGIGVRVHF
jgi:opacity protein-like surface antigen